MPLPDLSMSQDTLQPVVVILGPTAVGKTEIAIQLAERQNGEIVSADSRLFYRGMDIGTAKPTLEERKRAPHHLIDITEPDDILSLVRFQEMALQTIDEIHAHGRLPFLVGGTGQYIRAVTEGWQAPPVKPDPLLRAVLEAWAGQVGKDGLHARLAVLDPIAAGNIDYRNLRRTVRALEVILSTGERFSTQRRRQSAPYRTLLLGLNRPRPELYARIDARIETMLEAGLVLEVEGLLTRGFSSELPTLSAIGYREIIQHINGEITLDEAIIEIKRATRTLVRRQANWFKSDDPQIHWFQVGIDTVAAMEDVISNRLSVDILDK